MAELVDRNITDAMIDAVGREAAKGRMLIVATTDLDDQETMLWNMGEIATSASSADAFAAGNRALVLFGVPAANRQEVFRQMATLLLLSYALHNADFHAKNVALLYTSRADVHLAPAYDMITTSAYPDYANNPPAISFMGRKTWDPGKTLKSFITATFGLQPREQTGIIERIGDAMAETGPDIRAAMVQHPKFSEIGKRMLLAWQEGLASLRDKRAYAMGQVALGAAFSGFSDQRPAKARRGVVGRSDLLGKR